MLELTRGIIWDAYTHFFHFCSFNHLFSERGGPKKAFGRISGDYHCYLHCEEDTFVKNNTGRDLIHKRKLFTE
jgi:hypothetical protein